ncbi:PAS domain-containing protein [Candidatus Berkiella cookevillensis]|uniref:PAS domain-containing protein n=1 Tax=Candidatus Berkiella cookevillensis TaxID=437022 RepID=A0A0Q9YPQ0_9GAMM|nr:PAS domain-containing protein [Candidatus Berkiella cookevillensis]MCS5707647.1 PAS domain-containing protein [Candidatus Berkiella cookevillensis]
MDLSVYKALCNAIVLLMKPLVEVVIHDLSSGTICYIEGVLSKRQIGDPSLLELSGFEDNLETIVYPKLSFDGRLIKSISVPLSDKWLICINCDVSVFNQMQTLSQQFLEISQKAGPKSLFAKDWQEKLHLAIHTYLQEQAWYFESLTNRQKKEVAKHLFGIGAFNEKNATDYIASTLNIGRATLFKYLKEWRHLNHESI